MQNTPSHKAIMDIFRATDTLQTIKFLRRLGYYAL